MDLPEYPITPIIPRIREALLTGTRILLQADPGAGKTTLVPIAALECIPGGIWMLQSRRIAARAAARRIADLLGERVGERSGYEVSLESSTGPETRILSLTEGVFLRKLRSDPSLGGVGLVIFDEFHLRTLQGDEALSLCREVQRELRPDLRILVMSATLELDRISSCLRPDSVITSPGRAFPVESAHIPRSVHEGFFDHLVRGVLAGLARSTRGVLVFLPGEGEIRGLESALASRVSPDEADILPLFGRLELSRQMAALSPAADTRKRIVLATDIAETSLTIEGIDVVVDSGLCREPVYRPGSGLTRLETRRISRAAAAQRQGRAGRLGPGYCLRLWDPKEPMDDFRIPEILRSDLAPLALDLMDWGSTPGALDWVDPPPEGSWRTALSLLTRLGFLENGSLTASGRRAADLPVHPRLSAMLLSARTQGERETAALLAALLEERDILRTGGSNPSADILLRLGLASGSAARTSADAGGLARVRERAARILSIARSSGPLPAGSDTDPGVLLAHGFADRIAVRQESGLYILSGGRSVSLQSGDALSSRDLLVVCELDAGEGVGRIQLAAALSKPVLQERFPELFETSVRVSLEGPRTRVRFRREERIGGALAASHPVTEAPGLDAREALGGVFTPEGIAHLPWGGAALSLLQRARWLQHLFTQKDQALQNTRLSTVDIRVTDEELSQLWVPVLIPFLPPLRDGLDLYPLIEANLYHSLCAYLGPETVRVIDREVPVRISLPAGSSAAIDYSSPQPAIEARIQEVFGWTDTPLICGQSLLIRLLSPARRPVQITSDLAGFWTRTYPEVRKELAGRYPKHVWPLDPLTEKPTTRAKPRKTP